MLTSIPGVYRDGKIELSEPPPPVQDEARVIVTFLDAHAIDLAARGIDASRAAAWRARLSTFAEDWESPEMSTYDDYDAKKASI